MKKVLILLFLISFSFVGDAQHGYLGKRVGIEFGAGTNYALVNNVRDFQNYNVSDDLILPKLSFGFHVLNQKGKLIHWQAIYQQLPNSQISSLNVNETLGTNYNSIDTAWTKSNNLQFSLGFRRFRDLSPLGLYFEFQLKSNVVFNKSLYRSEYRIDYTDMNYFESLVKYNEYKTVSVVPEVGIAIGANYPLNDFITLDVGGKFNLTLGKFRDKDGDVDQIPQPEVFHRILSSRKLFVTNLFELYVSIILFP